MLTIQPADDEHYWLFLLSGLPVWVFFATSLQSASRSLLENANLIRKVRFPRQLVPLSMVATQLVGFAVMLAIVLVLSLVYMPRRARHGVAGAPGRRALRRASSPGFSLAVASLNAIYRDVEHLVAALLLPWFFLTPVLYSLESIPGVQDHPGLVDLIHWGNPLTPPVEAVRDPLYYGEPPAAGGRGLPDRRPPWSRSRSARSSSRASTTAWQSKSDPAVEDRGSPPGT